MLSVASAHIALPINRLRYVTHGAGSAQGAASRRRPQYPRAPASTGSFSGPSASDDLDL